MSKSIRNPFRSAGMRQAFDACVQNYDAGLYRNPDGTQNRGGSHKVSFWNGYNGLKDYYTVRGTLGWACYRAGQACRAEETGDPVPIAPRHRGRE